MTHRNKKHGDEDTTQKYIRHKELKTVNLPG